MCTVLLWKYLLFSKNPHSLFSGMGPRQVLNHKILSSDYSCLLLRWLPASS